MDCSEEKLPFLDVMIIKRGDIIITDIYYILTDTKQYLVYDSCHPKHIKNNIPYNLARRLCTNLLNSRLSELRYLLQQRNCPKLLVEQGIKTVTCHDRNELLQIKDKAKNYSSKRY